MPTLHWIGKEKVVNHHRDVPFRVLEHQYRFEAQSLTPTLSKGEGESSPFGGVRGGCSGGAIIHGDNLEALKSLLPEYEGRVKCIYIDPPYNTGNEGWVYNDNVNDPKIRKWLHSVVGREGEDLSRHDKWLCMMYPRLMLLHKLLANDGAIFISIDDNEQANLKLMCDEIFGAGNFIATTIWEKNDSPKMDSNNFSIKHDFILVYCKNFKQVSINQLEVNSEEIEHYNKLDKFGRRYYLKPLRAMGGQGETRESRPTLYYPLNSPDGQEIFPKRKDGSDGAWRWSKDKVNNEPERIEWTKGKGGWNPNYRIYADNSLTRPAETIWYHKDVGSNRTSKAEVNLVLTETNSFNTPKPSKLLERVVQISTDKDSIILDSFAGSGTTAHAVLNLNKQDGGTRKFILIEMEDYAETITAERVRRVMNGYGEGNKAVEGTGGSFDYYTLGEPLFKEDHLLNELVGLEKIRQYVWFTETHAAIPAESEVIQDSKYLLGLHNGMAYYFVYEAELVTTLDYDMLAQLKTSAASYLIYADNCLLPKDYLDQNNIVFKKIPRDISWF